MAHLITYTHWGLNFKPSDSGIWWAHASQRIPMDSETWLQALLTSLDCKLTGHVISKMRLPITVLLPKSANGCYILLSHQTGGWALFRVFPHSNSKERQPLFKRTWDRPLQQSPPSLGNITHRSPRRLHCSQVLAEVQHGGCGAVARLFTGKPTHIDTNTQTNGDLHAASSSLSQIRYNISLMCSIVCYTRHEASARVGAHSSKLWPYTGNRAKCGGWVLFAEWADFCESTNG